MCVCGIHLYDTDETNSILEIRLALYCSIFEEIKSTFFTVADFLSLRVLTLLIVYPYLYFFAVQIQERMY